MKEKMKYMYFSDGTDNGKPFDSLEEAVKYLYQQALHSKVHLDGVLKGMQVTEDLCSLGIRRSVNSVHKSVDTQSTKYGCR